ncbi:hypothetical protein ABID34_001803 [Chryseobacterium limigenitum]|nr:hypothetical protein [Chryseobacterium limigenitum]
MPRFVPKHRHADLTRSSNTALYDENGTGENIAEPSLIHFCPILFFT